MLADYAAAFWQVASGAERLGMIEDLYIKARSNALINKTAFFFALGFGLAVLVWPSNAVITADSPYAKALFQSAIVQTTITGVAALAYAVYSHYKRQQLAVENLMRYVLFSGDPVPAMVDRTTRALVGVDGFDFGEGIGHRKLATPGAR